MTVSSNLGAYLQLKLSGGTSNEDGNLSLGGQVAGKTILSQTVAALLSSKSLKRFNITGIASSSKRKNDYLVDDITQDYVNGISEDSFISGLFWLDHMPSFVTGFTQVGLQADFTYGIFFKKTVVSSTVTDYYAVLVPDIFLDMETMTPYDTGIAGTELLNFERIPWDYGVGYPTWTKYYIDGAGVNKTSTYAKKILTTTVSDTNFKFTYPAKVALTDPVTLNGYVEFDLNFSVADDAVGPGSAIPSEMTNHLYPFALKAGGNSYKKFATVSTESYTKNSYTISNLGAVATDTNRPDYKFNNGVTGIEVLDSGGWDSGSNFSIIFDLSLKRCCVLEDRWQEELAYTYTVSGSSLITNYSYETLNDSNINYHGWSFGDWSDVSEDGSYKFFNALKNKWVTVNIINSLLPTTGNRYQVFDIECSNKKNELFDSVKRAESHLGDEEYRCFYVVNAHTTETMWDVKVYIQDQPVSGVDTMELSLDPAGIGDGSTSGVALVAVDENTLPSYSRTVSTLTSSGTTATATVVGHEKTSGDTVTISGAVEANYNGTFVITVLDANSFTYEMQASETSPATGTITASNDLVFTAPTKLTPLTIGDLPPLKAKAVWIKRIVPPGVEVDVWDDWSSIGISGLI